MTRTRNVRTAVLGAVATAAVAALAWTALTPASAGSSSATHGWQDAVRASGAATASAVDPNITGAQRLAFTTHAVRGGDIDVGAKGQSPGDYFVFEERLTAGGNRIGTDSARCMLIVRTYRCDGTFFIDGRGSFEVSGSLTETGNTLAVTGGTDAFRNVRGQARIVGQTATTTDFVVELLP